MDSRAAWYVKTDEGKVYGPAEKGKLVTWAEEGRIDSVSFVSQDRVSWLPAPQLPELKMQWLVETEPGKIFGPFNRAVAIRLFKEKAVPPTSKVYHLHAFAVDQDPPPVERIVEVRVEVPSSRAVVASKARPLAKVQGSFFGRFDRSRLRALEAAAQQELAMAQRRGGAKLFGFLGGKKR